ncbi:M15 family metallopeptidase [Brucellaceae bacterium C25G]
MPFKYQLAGFTFSMICSVLMPVSVLAADLPDGFVKLSSFAPQIEQDIRYHGNHNFVGRSVKGYQAPECILTEKAATALLAAAKELEPKGLGFKVYDCYRPATAVADFAAWARDMDRREMQAEFYPRVNKTDLFDLGYIASRSGHSRGSTVDLAIRHLDHDIPAHWKKGDPLTDCALPESERFSDGILDFGTGYDCFDVKAHHGASGISEKATENRTMLADLMAKHGFKLYDEEWWHYTLVDEPFPDTYFDFPVTATP